MGPEIIAQMMTAWVGMAASLGIVLTFLQLLSEERESRRQHRETKRAEQCRSVQEELFLQSARM